MFFSLRRMRIIQLVKPFFVLLQLNYLELLISW